MPALLHGPRVGWPTSTGFKVWSRADGTGTATLETKLTTESDWNEVDSQSIDSTKDNTVVLEVTGLLGATLYDYRIKYDGTVVATSSTMTMPTSGRFVAYHISDGHSVNQSSFDWARTDWETNYEPLGVPGVIFQTGDLYQLDGTDDTIRLALDNEILGEVAEICGAGRAGERLPILFMWDDWDYAGNNTSKLRQNAYQNEVDPEQAALDMWDILWRDHEIGPSTSKGWAIEIAGVPFIGLDNRSERYPQSGKTPNLDSVPPIRGNEKYDVTNALPTFLGKEQRDWYLSLMRGYVERGLVVTITGSTITSQVASMLGGATLAARDSIGIFWKPERNYIFDALKGMGYAWRKTCVFWTGDDHRNSVFRGLDGEAIKSGGNPDPVETAHPSIHRGFNFLEFKVVSGTSQPPGFAEIIFGYGQWFDWSGPNHDCVVRWDINSTRVGALVDARITYVHPTGDQDPPGAGGIPTADEGEGEGKLGDFYYENGFFNYYDATSVEQSQVHPAENSPAPEPTFNRAFVDDVLGTMHSRDAIRRDEWGRLRRHDDIDELTREELKRIVPAEYDPPL